MGRRLQKTRKTRKTRKINKRQYGGIRFSRENLERPDIESPEAPWASNRVDYYMLTDPDISATSLDSIPGLTPDMKTKLVTNGISSEALLFFAAVYFSGQNYSFADHLKSIGIKYPAYLADIVSSKIWRLWGVGGVHESGVAPNINYEPSPSEELSENSKEKIYEYIWDHRMFDMLEILTTVGGSKTEFINKYLEYIYDSGKFMKSLDILDSASELFNDSMLGNYIREKYGVDEYESFVRSLKDPVKRVRTFIRNNAFERRKHLLPLLPQFQHRAQRRARSTRRLHH
jgi:hypothetical protein